MEEIIKELNELIDIASMSEEQYLEYHRNKYKPIFDYLGDDYYPPLDTYMGMVGEIQTRLEKMRKQLKGEKV
jgi:hypothetical protein